MGKTEEIKSLIRNKIDSGEGFEKEGNDLVAIKSFDEKYLCGNADGTLEWRRHGGNSKFFKMMYAKTENIAANTADHQVAFQCVQHNTFLNVSSSDKMKLFLATEQLYFNRKYNVVDKYKFLFENDKTHTSLLEKNKANELPMHIVLKSSAFSTEFVHMIVKDTLDATINFDYQILNFPTSSTRTIGEGTLVSIKIARVGYESVGGKYEVTDANEVSGQYYIREFYTKNQISTPFKREELVHFLSGANILHAILDQEIPDIKLLKDVMNNNKTICKRMCGNCNACEETPLDVAVRRNCNSHITRYLWDNMLPTDKTFILALKCGFLEESKLLGTQYTVGNSTVSGKDALFQCMLKDQQLQQGNNNDSKSRETLAEIVMTLVKKDKSCIEYPQIECDFEIRRKIKSFLADMYHLRFAHDDDAIMKRKQEKIKSPTVREILRRTWGEEHGFIESMQNWYNIAPLSLVIGNIESTKKNGNSLECIQFSTWGSRGCLFQRGKIYYECTVIKKGKYPQIGWCDETFEVSPGAYRAQGVGDFDNSWGIDGVREKVWNGRSQSISGVKWVENDVIGLAIDLDSPEKNFYVAVNGCQWVKVFSNMKYKGGLWPAITIDGHYNVNFGDENMRFGPPDDSYRSVIDQMKNMCLVQDIYEFVIKNRTLTPKQEMPTSDDIDESDKIDETDRLVFTNITSSMMKSNFRGTEPRQIRLKTTSIEKLNTGEDARNVKEAKMTDMEKIRVEEYPNLEGSDIELSINSFALHYLVSEGLPDEQMCEIIEVMANMVNQKDDASRLPIEIASKQLVKEKLWQKMKTSDLHLAMKARLWAVCKDLIQAKKDKNTEDKDNKELLAYLNIDDNHALHYAAKYGAPAEIWELILEIDKNLITQTGKQGRTVFHDLAEARASTKIIDCITKYFLQPKDIETIETLFRLKEEETNMLPIHYAAACRVKKDLLETYLKFSKSGEMGGALLLEEDKNGMLAFHWALHYDESKCNLKLKIEDANIDILLNAYRNIDGYEQDKILTTTANYYEKYFDKDQHTSCKNQYKLTPLLFALRSNLVPLSVVQKLIPEAPSEKDEQSSDDKKKDWALHTAAMFTTDVEIIDEIATNKMYKKDIVEAFPAKNKKDNKTNYSILFGAMTPLHLAAKYNREPKILKRLIQHETDYLFATIAQDPTTTQTLEKNIEAENKKKRFSTSSINKFDDLGYLPLHYAAGSKFGTTSTIKALIDYYRYMDPDQGKGGTDIQSQKEQYFPLHLAIKADKYRSKISYSSIVFQMIEENKEIVTMEQTHNPLKLTLDPKNTQRLKKVTQELIETMLECYNNSKITDVPKDIDLSLWTTINDTAFREYTNEFINIFDRRIDSSTLGAKLSHQYPGLFKGTSLINSDNNNSKKLKWKYWFILHGSIFECVEKMKTQDKDVTYGLSNLTSKFYNAASLDFDFKKMPSVIDCPLGDMLNAEKGKLVWERSGEKDPESINDDIKKWLMPILEKIDTALYTNKNDDNDGNLFPSLTSPLGYAVRNGCTRAIIALSKGGCNPVQDCFPTINGSTWAINPYEIANFAGAKMDTDDKERWGIGMKAMRSVPKTKLYRDRKAVKRLFSPRKIPLEIITIVLIAIVGIFATTGNDTQQLRWANHISDKFIDEEFDFDDAHIKKTFFDIATIEEFWQWVYGPLYGGLYPEDEIFLSGRKAIDEVSVLVGSVRIRQVRAKKVACANRLGTHESALPVGGCHRDKVDAVGSYETEPFGPGGKYKFSVPAHKYYENTVIGDRLWEARYLKGGYVVELPGGNATKALEILKELQDDNFVSAKDGTRLMLFDFNIYNPHIDRIAAMRLMVEFWVGGGSHSNLDITLLQWNDGDETAWLPMLAKNLLVIIFIGRFLFEIEEMAWKNLQSIQRRVKYGDTSGSIEVTERVDYNTLRNKGLNFGGYRWKPWKCCDNRKRIGPMKEKKNENHDVGISLQIVAMAGKMKSGLKRKNSMHNKITTPSPFSLHAKKDHKIILSCMDNFNDWWAGVQVTCFVLRHFLTLQLPMAFQLANGFKYVDGNEKDATKKDFVLGKNHKYYRNPFHIWWATLRYNKYFNHYWNLYEIFLVFLYVLYWGYENLTQEYKLELKNEIVAVLESGDETYIPLDRLSWAITWQQDLAAVLFISIGIHLLSIM
jgi:ankyrin repeat protein